MREISPSPILSVEEYVRRSPTERKVAIDRVCKEKNAGTRSWPSGTLIDGSALLTAERRRSLLDKVGSLVDENVCGRSDMCLQFALLLERALTYMGLPARAVGGTAIYFDVDGNEIHRWDHAWVRVGDEVVDGNVDYLAENPTIPPQVRVCPYWGPVKLVPGDRRLREDRSVDLLTDSDVDDIWWPELKAWIDSTA